MKTTHTIQPVLLAGVAFLALVAGRATAAEPAAPAEPVAKPRHVRVLAIGNSFSRDATRYLGRFAKEAGHKLTLGSADIGACSLQRHWSYVEANEADPNRGRRYRGRSLKQHLTSRPWDYVTIQQLSTQSYRVGTYRPYASKLADYVRRHAPDAELLMHQTWAYRQDDKLFRDGDFTPAKMFAGLQKAYATIADEIDARILPVGEAFQVARNDPNFRFTYPDPNFDYNDPTYPQLPREPHSLHRGGKWVHAKGGGKRFLVDTHHASPAGRYLAAAVWYEVLFEEDVRPVAFVPDSLTPATARFLRDVAHRVVRQGPATRDQGSGRGRASRDQ